MKSLALDLMPGASRMDPQDALMYLDRFACSFIKG